MKCSASRLFGLLGVQAVLFLGSFTILEHHHQSALPQLSDPRRQDHHSFPQVVKKGQRKPDHPPSLPQLSTKTTNILLVHVGKTGGETLKHILRVGCLVRTNPLQKEKCWRKFLAQYNQTSDDRNAPVQWTSSQGGEPLLSKLVAGYLHYKKMTPPDALETATHLLFTVRHPLARLQSWFRYITPLNCIVASATNNQTTITKKKLTWQEKQHKYAKGTPVNCRIRQTLQQDANQSSYEAQFFACFPTLEYLAQTLPSAVLQTRDKSKRRCVDMLRELLRGTSQHYVGSETLLGHWVMNYRYYVERTLLQNRNLTILVARTESMWEDLKQLDRFVGGTGSDFRKEGLRVTHSERYVDQALLTPQASRHLCCVLQHELVLYRFLVQQAVNLNATERQWTLQQTSRYCGIGENEEEDNHDAWPSLLQQCAPYSQLSNQPPLAL